MVWKNGKALLKLMVIVWIYQYDPVLYGKFLICPVFGWTYLILVVVNVVNVNPKGTLYVAIFQTVQIMLY